MNNNIAIKRIIAISDIHGCYERLVALLRLVNYSEREDTLILLGDYIDRGPNSYSVVKLIQHLQKENGKDKVIAIRGNHEQMLIDDNGDWDYNGKENTIISYKLNNADHNEDKQWFRSLPFYFKRNNFVFVHAGIDPDIPMSKQSKFDMLWTREFYYDDTDLSVIFGHTPTIIMFGTDKPIAYNKSFNIDTGCVYGGKLTALIIENDVVTGYKQV